jgi:hypothetical protein
MTTGTLVYSHNAGPMPEWIWTDAGEYYYQHIARQFKDPGYDIER